MVTPRVLSGDGARRALLRLIRCRLHPKWRTPVAAILLQGAWAIVLLFSNKYGELLDYVVFGDWIFFGLNGVALLHAAEA